MNEITKSGNVPLTIDINGNVVPRRYGASRWSTPKVYSCAHNECTIPATVLKAENSAHNCCNNHDEKEGLQ